VAFWDRHLSQPSQLASFYDEFVRLFFTDLNVTVQTYRIDPCDRRTENLRVPAILSSLSRGRHRPTAAYGFIVARRRDLEIECQFFLVLSAGPLVRPTHSAPM
jgi:hypothetical protein